MKVSIALIVKNEESCLEKCLESVKDADEIVVVDTGSTDKTVEIAKKYTDKIFHFKWVDDFSKARNFAKSKCLGDWILSVDADHQILSDMDLIRSECERLEREGHKVGAVKSQTHFRSVLFKNCDEVYWEREIHETLNLSGVETKIEEVYGHSDSHKLDPDRNLRILLKSEKTPRTKFYLGREYFEKKNYDESIKWMEDYLKEATWTPEIAEAYLTISKCYWFSQQGSKAREVCLKTIGINPDFKEALNLMSEMTYEPLKSKWKNLASVATNKDVLFIRI